jgi:sugar fermentation stimulation protein A
MTIMLYTYPPLHAGILLKRYKRFLADIELETGEVVTAHCANTGPMTGICTPGSRVLVSYSSVTTRKLPYTWEAIEVNDNEPTWVIVNTALPNRIVKLALVQHLFPELGNYSQIRCEVPYGADRKSRVDFLLNGDRPLYIEVKSTTWAQQRLARFPDTETIRGQKHLRELSVLLPQARAVMFYAINRGDCTQFAPGDAADPVYGQLLREAMQLGLEVLPCRFEVTPVGVRYLGLAELKI